MEERALSPAQELSAKDSLTDLIISTTALDESGLLCRVPGAAVFLSAQPKGAPASLLHNIRHNRVLHKRNTVLTIVTDRIPYVSKNARVEIKDPSHGFFRIIAHFGFVETPTIGELIQSCALKDFVIEELKTSFFSRLRDNHSNGKTGVPRRREYLFVAMSHHAQRRARFFKLPS
jgi:KUP system potassium uptake protein